MCELSKRTWRTSITPQRTILGLAALGSLVAGVLLDGPVGLTFLGVAGALLITVVAVPAIKEVEYGFPVGVKVRAATQDRIAALRAAFQDQRGEIELCAHHLCGDPKLAAELLEAAWARTTMLWRGPPTAALRLYVLCTLIHLCHAEQRWAAPPQAASSILTPLDRLNPQQRVAVVLKEFAGLSTDDIRRVTGQSADQVADHLRTAELALSTASATGDGR